MEVLKAQIPAILIPRTDGQKMEQFIRCFTLEPLNVFKVCTKSELFKLPHLIKEILENDSFPEKHSINLNGVKESSNVIREKS